MPLLTICGLLLVTGTGITELRAEVSTYTMADFSSAPISLTETNVSPQVIINSSQDHQLFFKAYNDYADLDSDGLPDTTYTHSIDYYGYFDAYKCYNYDSTDKRFEPAAVTSSKYCTAADGNDGYWSGNFLNWASMTRVDTIRKILFGGHRRVDKSSDTVLERAFIPPDIHAFAKFYDGTDINDLTPFTANTTAPTGNSGTSVTIGTGIKNLTTSPGDWIQPGDYLTLRHDATRSMQGWVTSFDSATGALAVNVVKTENAGTTTSPWSITNHTRTGLTFCNVTASTANDYSQNITDPPLIRVAAGNYTFWDSGEVHQCLWEEEDPGTNGKNYNDPYYSEIYAAQDNPKKWDVGVNTAGALGVMDNSADFVVRVQVCVDADNNGEIDLQVDADGDGKPDNNEKCKKYPYGNHKPTGLLQTYGDEDELKFGMIAGTYGKATRGGEMVQKVRNSDGMDGMCREINLGIDCNEDGDVDGGIDVSYADQDDWNDPGNDINIGDGTFKRVYDSIGGPINQHNKSEGIINTWSLFRIYGYKYGSWTYSITTAGGDKCPLSINFFGDTSDSECHNWGNPFAEIYLSGLRYFAGENAPTDYQSGDGQFIEGINYNTGSWLDPLTADEYCSRLSVVNFNSSLISADTVLDIDPGAIADELDTNAFGVIPDLGSSRNSRELTEIIGRVENIYPDAAAPDRKWFVGETAADDNRKCTAKEITDFGEVRGLCPEGPDTRGGFRIAGLAWYAHTNDIRPTSLNGGRGLEGIQKVDTYAVRLAAGNPVIDIPIPNSSGKVTLLPSCITNNKDDYGCTMVDFKIIHPHSVDDQGTPDPSDDIGTGKFMVIWEDSLQGNDYDLDAGGIIEYKISSTDIKITTGVTLENLGYAIGHGYVISGTTEDGLHIHSGTNGFDYTYENDATSTVECNNCFGIVDGGTITSQTYTLGNAVAGLLEDPLWYAAKWGGFDDSNDNDLPDLVKEWDSKINATGETGTDGIPDNYFYAAHPQQLEDSLDRIFATILERTSSGTAAAVVSNNVRGEGALYQAYYEPLKKDLDENQATWIGTVHALWLDSFGYSRQDCSPTDNIPLGSCTPNGILDNYDIDQVTQSFFDEDEARTRVKIFTSDNPDEFSPYSIEGVVSSYSTGAVTLVPYSMEAMVTSYNARAMTLVPYSMTGIIDTYDPDTGALTMTVSAGTLVGPTGNTYTKWQFYDATSLLSGKTEATLTLTDTGSLSFTVEPGGDWIAIGDTITLSTYNLVGEPGKNYNYWVVDCLSGAGQSVVTHSVTLAETGDSTITVEDDAVLDTCDRIKLSTFNVSGTIGETYDAWKVANLSTGNNGTSSSSVTLVDSGTLNFSVSPTLDWIVEGDRLYLSNYEFAIKELYEIGFIWNAREELYLESLTDAEIKSNRIYGANASTGRHIMTWIDTNLDGIVDAGEYIDFEQTMFPAASYGFFDLATQADAENLVNYVRGVEIPGFRSRTVRYKSDDITPKTMRLGDVINSTPTIVGAPQEGFNIIKYDTSYTAFRQQYAERRLVAYVGGNDGMLHALNAGFYTTAKVDANDTILNVGDAGYDTAEKKIMYSVSGKNGTTGAAAIEHPLGSEIWAYAPLNLLPHLKWLKDTRYSHVYYVDSKPRVFDANIFTPDADHPNGWGTVLVVGMGFGGGAMTIDTAADGLGAPNAADDTTMRSAYTILDITNPEKEPTLLAEIQIPDGSFSLVYPTILAFRDINGTTNKWYLLFGSGPDSLDTAASTSTAKSYIFDFAEIALPGTTIDAPIGCTIESAGNTAMNVIQCDSGIANTFMGSPVAVDWDLDFYVDTAYFGLVGNNVGQSGAFMRLTLNQNADPDPWGTCANDPLVCANPSTWLAPDLLAQTNQPVISLPGLSLDELGNRWIFFGTGRYYVMADKTSIATQTLYGIKDDNTEANIGTDLIDATDIEVYTDDLQTITDGPTSSDPADLGAQIDNFPDLVSEIDDYKRGWFLDLPPIVGTVGVAPATRILGQPAIFGGIVFTSAFQPSANPCEGEGYSRLYGLYYKTGTAYPSGIFGTEATNVNGTVMHRALKYVNLGKGMATSPTLHSGSGSGDDSISIFTQLSTGDIFRQDAKTAYSVRSGKRFWRDQ